MIEGFEIGKTYKHQNCLDTKMQVMEAELSKRGRWTLGVWWTWGTRPDQIAFDYIRVPKNNLEFWDEIYELV